MPEEHGEHASSGHQDGFDGTNGLEGQAGFGREGGFDNQDGFGEFHDRGEFDEFDDDEGEADRTGRVWPETGSPPGGYPPPPGRRSGSGGRRGRRALLIALTAVLAGTAGFGLVAAALRELTGSPAAASSSPAAQAPGGGAGAGVPSSGAGTGTRLSPLGGGVPSLAPGATLQLEIAGPVTAVTASSITIGGGDRAIKAAVTRATAVTGKVTSVGGIKVGDVVSATIAGADGKLTAQSIQDPASLPSAPGQ